MRWGDLFGRTLRDVPGGGGPGAGLAQRAALARLPEEACCLLPTGRRVVARIEHGLASGLPDAAPLTLPPGKMLEPWSTLVRDEVRTYRQLPAFLSARRHVRLHAERPTGLARPAWTSAHQWVALAANPDQAREAERMWRDCGEAWAARHGLALQRAERGDAWGWVVAHPDGPQAFLACETCVYCAEDGLAQASRIAMPDEPPQEVSRVATPGADTIRLLADMLSIPTTKTLKALFLQTKSGELVLAVVRGDLDVSLAKLERLIGMGPLRPADVAAIRAAGAEPGYGGPIGLKVRTAAEGEGALVVGDPSIEGGKNFVSGANQAGYHFTGLNYPRDFEVSLLADIAVANPGDPCPWCDSRLRSFHGFWVGVWHSLPEPFTFTGEDGRDRTGAMGLGTFYLEPLLAALIEALGTERGLAWPADLAPFDVHVVALMAWEGLEGLEVSLKQAGLACLIDDRPASAGVKFTDADLVGAPVRMTISARSLAAGGLEVSGWGGERREIVPLGAVLDHVRSRLVALCQHN